MSSATLPGKTNKLKGKERLEQIRRKERPNVTFHVKVMAKAKVTFLLISLFACCEFN
jgi:hypothetical protein